MGDGAQDIAAERQRQVEQEGWTPEHDDAHGMGPLVRAAVAYCVETLHLGAGASLRWWPWDRRYWKPVDHTTVPGQRRMLVKAGALIAAAIDRLDRLEASDGR